MSRYARTVAAWIDAQLERAEQSLDDPELAAIEIGLCRLACSLLMDAPSPEREEGSDEDDLHRGRVCDHGA